MSFFEEKKLRQVVGQALQGLAAILTDDNAPEVKSGSLDDSEEDFRITGTPLKPEAVGGIKDIEFKPSRGELTIRFKKI